MRWLATYRQRDYTRIRALIHEYEQGKLGIAAFVSDLDATLNIWEHVTEDWDDPFLTKWTELERIHKQTLTQGEQQLDEADCQLVAQVAAELKQRVSFIYEQRQYQQMLAAIEAYEQGKLGLGALEHELSKLLLGLDEPILYSHPAWTEVFDLEDAVSSADWWMAQGLEDQYRQRIIRTVNSLKNIIQGLLSEANT